MTQRCLKVLTRSLLGLVALVTVGIGALSAQSTGKVQGYVRDAQGHPIANATVVIVGTSFNAPVNAQGYYFIENIPAGTVSILARYVGYKQLEKQGLRISAGQTMQQDFILESTPVVLEAISVEAAKNPLVPRDEVTTKQTVTGDMVQKLPVDRITQVLALQPGVTQVSNCGTNGPCTPLISVRGGRVDQNATYIDGVPVQNGIHTGQGTATGGNFTMGAPQLTVSTNGFEEASVTTGASSAAFGNAQGGIINISTRGGGQKFNGNLSFETGLLGFSNYGQGFNAFAGSIGGPITKHLTFFASGRVEGNNTTNGGNHGYLFPGYARASIDTTYEIAKASAAGPIGTDSVAVPVYNYAVVDGGCDLFKNVSNAAMASNYGQKCHANQSYIPPSTSYFTTDKLNYTFGQGSRVALSYIFSGNQNIGQQPGNNISNCPPVCAPLTDGSTSGVISGANVATLNWTQTLIRNPTHQLTLDAFLSRQWGNTTTSRLTPESQQSVQGSSPLGIITKKLQFRFSKNDYPLDSTLIYNVLLNRAGHRVGITDGSSSGQYGTPVGTFNSTLPPDGLPYSAGGGGADDNSLTYSYENRWLGKADLDFQADRYNRLKVGGEYTKFDIGAYNNSLQGTNMFTGKPVSYDMYAEDRVDLGDVVLVGGVRYDYYWSKAWRWNEYPEISSRPGFTQDSLFCAPGTTPSATAKCALVQDPSHNYLSPHVQVSFPVTDKTNFRLSYAQNVQAPDFQLLYTNALSDINTSGQNSRSRWGQDLDFGKTITFEFGARHAFSDDMVLDVAVYNNDIVADPSFSFQHPIDPVNGNAGILYLVENTDFGNTRGLDVRLDRRIGSYFNGSLSYSFQDSKNTGTDPAAYLGFFEPLSGFTGQPPTAALPTGTSRPHSLTAVFNASLPADWEKGNILGTIFKRTGFFVTGRVASGTAYTRCDPTNSTDYSTTSGNPCASLSALASNFNGARLPSLKQLDLRFTKDFRIGKYQMTGYLDARNLLNLTNVVSVYSQTGTTTNLNETKARYSADSVTFATYGAAAGEYRSSDGALTLPTIAGCGKVANGANSLAPECYYYVKSEQRFGNGDGVYTLAEQRAASDSKNAAANSIYNFVTGARTIRFGLEVNF